MVDGVRTFDPVESFQRGRRGALGIQQQEQQIAAQPLRNQLVDVQLQRQQQALGQEETTFGQTQAIQRATILGQSAQALKGLPLEQRDAAFASISPQLEQFGIDPTQFQPGSFTDINLDQAIAESQAFIGAPTGDQFTLGPGQQRFGPGGQPIAQVAPKPTAFQLKPGEQRFEDGRVVATGAPLPEAVIPQVLLTGLSTDLANKGAAAFSAAGGGKDGVKAFTQVIDKGSEQERRLASPQILQNSFPEASQAEQAQLQAAMDSAKTTESGLKEAGKVRTEQRRLKKAQVFQNRTVELLGKVLANPELNDVLGSVEGTDEGFVFGEKIRSDLEAEAIADIKELESLLTAENLSLMTGVLSETDIKIIRQLGAGALIRTRREERFVEDTTSLRDRLSSQLVQTADDTATDRERGAQQPPASPPSGRQGGQLMTDAQGNRAFVFPDGTFEEVR